MESRKGEMVRLVFVMMLVMLQRSVADDNFPNCYALCLNSRCRNALLPIVACAAVCLAKCYSPTTSLEGNQYYCQLGCATSKCSSISSRDNLDGEAVKSCVNTCSQGCKRL